MVLKDVVLNLNFYFQNLLNFLNEVYPVYISENEC